MSKTEQEIKLELDLKAASDKASELEAKLKSYESALTAKETEVQELKQFKAQAEEQSLAAAKALEESKLETELTKLQSEKVLSPAMKPYVKALLSEEKKEYAFKQDEKEEKFSKPELLKHILKLYSEASKVNFEESSEDVEVKNEKDESALNEQINKYASEHNISYGDAYKAILKK